MTKAAISAANPIVIRKEKFKAEVLHYIETLNPVGNYAGKYVAVRNNKVVASNESSSNVIEKVMSDESLKGAIVFFVPFDGERSK